MQTQRAQSAGRRRQGIFILSAAAAALLSGAAALAAPFTPGDLVVDRVIGGTQAASEGAVGAPGSAPMTGGGITAAVYLDEYTPTGTWVQSIVLPYNSTLAAAQPGNNVFGQVGGANTEGFLALSDNGQYFVAGGYKQSAYVTGVNANGSSSLVVPRVVALVNMNGGVNTQTALTDVSSGQAFRSAYSSDGIDIWTNGTNGGNVTINSISVPTNGIHYSQIGAATSTQIQNTGAGGNRALKAFNQQLLLANTGTPSTFRGVTALDTNFAGSKGPGLVTTTNLPGFSTTSDQTDDFWFANSNTLYTADVRTDGTNGGVRKYIFSDTNADTILDTWVFQYNVTLGLSTGTGNVGGYGIVGTSDGTNAAIYVTTFDGTAINANRIDKITDLLTGSTPTDKTNAQASLQQLALSTDQYANSAFRGIQIVPANAPEPGSMGLMLAATGLAALRRRGRSAK